MERKRNEERARDATRSEGHARNELENIKVGMELVEQEKQSLQE